MPKDPIVRLLEARGGLTTRDLRQQFTKRQIAQAVADGLIVRDSRGHYALPRTTDGLRDARRLSAVAVGRTAAATFGWRLKTDPPRPELAVPRGRKVSKADRTRYQIRWRSFAASDLHSRHLTSKVRTVLDCAIELPFDESLAVADSALRNGSVTREELLVAAARIKRTGRLRALRVAMHADHRAENPFESVVRALSLDVPGLNLHPQVPVRSGGRIIHPDLADKELRIVVEADSFEFHTNRRQIDIDCERYTELGLDGWLVVRVSHRQAMQRQDWVRSAFHRATQLRRGAR
ncbi:MAG: hypothetical protein ABIZ07_13115 [Dermatophilaceae bacterium]